MAEKLLKTLRDFPSVEELLSDKKLSKAVSSIPRVIATDIVRIEIANSKSDLKPNHKAVKLSVLTKSILEKIRQAKSEELSQVINGTGTLIHTNLGRSPFGATSLQAIINCVSNYTNLEFDIATGKRGSRGVACEKYLAKLTTSESATVVNNCAAALMITLNTFANKKSVIISRGELVQIGGGFRIPDILKKSGAKLVEIGTTNITNLKDYKDAIDSKTAVILKVHRSNFTQSGFTDDVPLVDLQKLCEQNNILLINDIGSGLVSNTPLSKKLKEPTVQQSVKAQTGLTLFSGDKLLGSVQAGIIVGTKELVSKVKKNPLFRTMRLDKLLLAMLEHSAKNHLDANNVEGNYLWKFIGRKESDLYTFAKEIAAKSASKEFLKVEASSAYIGGGTTPEKTIPSVALVFDSSLNPNKLLKEFRLSFEIPIIGRIENDSFMIDLVAISEEEFPVLISSIINIIKKLK